MSKIPVVVIAGPTASGKTGLAIEIAKKYNGEVVSADSMQIYKEMDIGTAKPSIEEMQGIPHHMIDVVSPYDKFSAGEYSRLAEKCIQDIYKRGKLPIVVGGTGLYISALLDGSVFSERISDEKIKARLTEQCLSEQSRQELYEKLSEVDPVAAEKIHINNTVRLVRALEVYEITGIPISEWQKTVSEKCMPYETCMIALGFQDREILYSRINDRVDIMIQQGLINEIRGLCRESLSTTAKGAIGYKEMFDYLDGNSTLDESIELIKRQTRRYAKRQLTWFRRDKRYMWYYRDDHSDINREIDLIVSKFLENK